MKQEKMSRGGERKSRSALLPFCSAFLGAVLFGLVAHGMGILNKFSSHDDIFSLFMTGATITSGRWMLHVLSEAEILLFGDGHFSLPLINGLFSLVCIGFSAGVMIQLLKIRNPVFSALLGMTMAAFPTITALFGFMFAAPYYMLALAMTAAGAYLICEESKWWKKALGMLIAGCAVGIYQAFLPILLAMILLSDLRAWMETEETLPSFLMRAGVQALCVAGAMGVYAAGSRFFLWKEGLELDSYMGIADVGSVPLATYLQRAGRAYRECLLPSRNVLWDMFPQHAHYLYLMILAVNAAMGLWLAVRTGKRKRCGAVILIALLMLFPLGSHFIFVMSEEVHSLMTYGEVMQIVLFVFLADRTAERLRRIKAASLTAGYPGAKSSGDEAGAAAEKKHFRLSRHSAVCSGAALLLTLLCIMEARYDNQCYLKAGFQQQEAISWNVELITRIKSAEGYRDELPVAWIGRENNQDKSLYHMDELNLVQLAGYDQNLTGYINNWAWSAFMARWCGFSPLKADAAEVETWLEVQAMPSYPADGSVQVIRDVVVVHF